MPDKTDAKKVEIETFVGIVLDQSGSMGPTASDTIGGFNTFLDAQTKVEGIAKLWLVKFSTAVVIEIDGRDIQEASKLDATSYRPGGGTALLDAIGETIERIGARIAALPAGSIVPRVIVAIITDGEENASHRFQLAAVKQTIEAKTAHGWVFTYLGANVDAFTAAASIGIAPVFAANYVAERTGAVFAAASNMVMERRTVGASVGYSTMERRSLLGEDAAVSLMAPPVTNTAVPSPDVVTVTPTSGLSS